MTSITIGCSDNEDLREDVLWDGELIITSFADGCIKISGSPQSGKEMPIAEIGKKDIIFLYSFLKSHLKQRP